MAREPINRKWNEIPDAPDQYEEPNNATWEDGWRGGAAEEPPEAKYQNWWQRRVDDALQDIERMGAPSWVPGAIYQTGAYARGSNGIIYRSQIDNNEGIDPATDVAGNWQTFSGYIIGLIAASEQFAISARTISAGNGLSGGGTLSANRTISMGTPSSSGASTSNSVTAGSHTHSIQQSTFQNTRSGDNDGGFVTPATLHGAFGGPAVSQSDRGFQLLPGGVLLNWTSTNVVAPGGSQTVSFPEPYKQSVFNVQVSVLRNSNAENENNSVSFSFNGLSSVIARNNSNSNRTIYIFAIGV